jgi:hypothetical protein
MSHGAANTGVVAPAQSALPFMGLAVDARRAE